MSSLIDPEGNLDRTSDAGLYALAWAWETKSRPQTDDSPVDPKLIDNARKCHQAAYQRELPGSRRRLVHFYWRNGMKAEALELAEQAIAQGHTDYLLETAREVGGHEAIGYLRRAGEAGLDVGYAMAHRIADNAVWQPNTGERAEILRLLLGSVDAREKEVRDALVSGAEGPELDRVLTSHMRASSSAGLLCKQIDEKDVSLQLFRRYIDIITGPALGRYVPTSPENAKSLEISRCYDVGDFADALVEARDEADSISQRRRAVIEELSALAEKPGDEHPALWFGVAKLYLDASQESKRNRDRDAMTFALERAVNASGKAVRAGVPGSENVLMACFRTGMRFDGKVDGVDCGEKLLSLAVAVADRGDVKSLEDTARFFSETYGKDDLARRAWDAAVARGVSNVEHIERLGLDAFKWNLGAGASNQELLEMTDRFVETSSIVHGDASHFYESAAIESSQTYRSDRNELTTQLFERRREALLQQMVEEGTGKAINAYGSTLFLSRERHRDSSGHLAGVKGLMDSAEEIARRHPNSVRDLERLLGDVADAVERDWPACGFELKSPTTGVEALKATTARLKDLQSSVAEVAFEVAPEDELVVSTYAETLSARGEDAAVVELGRRFARSFDERRVPRAFVEAAKKVGDHTFVDEVGARDTGPPNTGGVDDVEDNYYEDSAPWGAYNWARDLSERDLPDPVLHDTPDQRHRRTVRRSALRLDGSGASTAGRETARTGERGSPSLLAGSSGVESQTGDDVLMQGDAGFDVTPDKGVDGNDVGTIDL